MGEPDSFKGKRRVLIAVDGSEIAKENILRPDDAVIIMRAQKKPFVPYLVTQQAVNQIETEEIDQAVDELSVDLKVVEEHTKKAYLIEGTEIRNVLLDSIHKLNPSIVVVGSRGLGAVKRMMMGSVSEYLLHHLTMPVVIVKM